eukprot:scaffold4253_cov48-Phaeocystis_antarctica.AAC.1
MCAVVRVRTWSWTCWTLRGGASRGPCAWCWAQAAWAQQRWCREERRRRPKGTAQSQTIHVVISGSGDQPETAWVAWAPRQRWRGAAIGWLRSEFGQGSLPTSLLDT